MKRLLCAVCLVFALSPQAWSADGNGVTSSVLSKSGSSWDGTVLPGYPSGAPEITILRIKIPPGAVLPVHKHPVINAGMLISGELTVIMDDGKTLHLKTGDGIIEVVNQRHYGKNEGNIPAEIVVFYAGTPGAPLTVNQ